MQPMPDWSDVWPVHAGVYLFYGYPINKAVDQRPRLVLITVESGPVYRTPRTTMKKATGAAGFFMPLLSPRVYPDEGKLDKMAEAGLVKMRKHRTRKLKKSLSEEFK
jgi:hypothetical protein